MATQIPKPQSLCSYHLSKNKKRLLWILLASAILILAAVGAYKAHRTFYWIHREILHTQFAVERYQRQVVQEKNREDVRITQLEQAWKNSEAKLFSQEERIRKLEHLLAQRSLHPDMREVNLLQELQVQKDLYIQAQQKIHSYEQQLLALTHEMKHDKEQNQLIRQEQAKIRAEHQELLNQRPQVSQEQLLKKSLESWFSQLANADYELEQKVKDIQKAVESCAKIGELKALEVYYDDKLENLSRVLQKSNNTTSKDLSDNSQFKQLKQDLIKLAEQEERIKAAFNNLGGHQKNNEERLKALESQGNLKTINARLADAPVQSPHELLKEAIKNYNLLSQSGQNKKELKEAKKHIKQLHRQINQQPEEIYHKIQQDAMKQTTSQGKQKEQVKVSEKETLNQSPFERELGNDIANLINAFVDLYEDL